jgi:hypothetical protein
MDTTVACTFYRHRALTIVALLGASLLCTQVQASQRVLGWLEWARLEPGHIKIKTKLDTGAKTSSIDADDIEAFTRDNHPWVRFRVPLGGRPDDSDHGVDLFFELPVLRETRIKHHVLNPTTRYVVHLKLCVGGTTFTTPVTLADRRRFNYPLLLGRLALKGRALVDAGRIFTASHSCAAPNSE